MKQKAVLQPGIEAQVTNSANGEKKISPLKPWLSSFKPPKISVNSENVFLLPDFLISKDGSLIQLLGNGLKNRTGRKRDFTKLRFLQITEGWHLTHWQAWVTTHNKSPSADLHFSAAQLSNQEAVFQEHTTASA